MLTKCWNVEAAFIEVISALHTFWTSTILSINCGQSCPPLKVRGSIYWLQCGSRRRRERPCDRLYASYWLFNGWTFPKCIATSSGKAKITCLSDSGPIFKVTWGLLLLNNLCRRDISFYSSIVGILPNFNEYLIGKNLKELIKLR